MSLSLQDFRKGMNAYLLKFQHKNASTGEGHSRTHRPLVVSRGDGIMCNLFISPPSPSEDLWECLEQASGKPIAAVMSSWTKQMGFPIIVVDQEQVSCPSMGLRGGGIHMRHSVHMTKNAHPTVTFGL